MPHDGLRELEHLVLLAISRLDPPVHGVPIVRELQTTVARTISRASVYVVLRRLEAKGLVSSTLGDPTPERGGRAKRLYALTPLAIRALRTARRNFVRLWAGSRVLLVVAALLLPRPAAAGAQPSPFTGTWLSLSDANATDIETAAHLPNALLTIVHDGPRVSRERSWTTAPIPATFHCDGRVSRNGYSSVVERTACRWEPGPTLVIEGTIGRADPRFVAGRLRERYWIDVNDILHVERTREVFSIGQGPRTYTQQYRRVSPRAGSTGR